MLERVWRNENPPTLSVGVLIGTATVENSMDLVAQTVKNLPTMQDTQVWSLGQEDPLEKEVVAHSIILAWRIPWTEEPGRLHYSPSVHKELDVTERLTFSLKKTKIELPYDLMFT